MCSVQSVLSLHHRTTLVTVSFVAELRGSGGTVTPCPEESKAKKQPTIWKHAEAENVAKLCISDMMTSGAQIKANPKNLQWRGNYLCLASETSSTIPARILQQAFNRRNITDQEALTTGLCLYRLGGSAGERQYPVLVLEPQNPLMQAHSRASNQG